MQVSAESCFQFVQVCAQHFTTFYATIITKGFLYIIITFLNKETADSFIKIKYYGVTPESREISIQL